MTATTTKSPTAVRLDELKTEIAEVEAAMKAPPRRGESAADRTRLRWRKELLELESQRLYRDSRAAKRDAAQADYAAAAAEVEQIEAAMKQTEYGKLYLQLQDARNRMTDARALSTDLAREVGAITKRVYELDAAQSHTQRRLEQMEGE
jgi:chromosome segregation ATPase